MGTFADKLRRIDGLRSEAIGRGLSEVARGGAVADDVVHTGVGLRLTRVRERLGALLDGVSVCPPAGDLLQAPLELPFVREHSAVGLRHVRTLYHGSDEPYGEARLGAALGADPRILSLLALDPAIAGCRHDRALYLDTETTGLGAAAGHVAFLVGMAWYDEDRDQMVLEQLLLRDPGDELALLERVRDRIAAADLLVSYNGKSFDLPVLRTRFVMARVAPPREPAHLDLLLVARRVHKHRRFRKNLGCIEREVLGYHRGPDVGGEEVAARYLHYLHTGDASLLAEVVEHNRHDVMSLVALMGLYGAPLELHDAPELAAVASTVLRTGDVERAQRLADAAVERDPCAVALEASARIAKAAGDRRRALERFEELAEQIDDAGVRLELAKLYEHFARDPERALAVALQGTGERAEQAERRRQRLARKTRRAS